MTTPPEHIKLKDLDELDRPREKLMRGGLIALSDAELLGILINSGTREHSAVDIARHILLAYDNNLNELGRVSVDTLRKSFKGIGEARAITIVAALELGRRRKISDALQRPCIKSSKDAFEILQSFISDLQYEEFWVMLLNRANNVICTQCMCKGGISGSVVDVRLIIKLAIDRLASGIIVAHNHPSGSLQPSNEDRSVTNKISEAAKLLDMKLLDHLIISPHGYYSFADEGNL